MEPKAKDCPSCKQPIQNDASFCPHCGWKFDVKSVGYCSTCHEVRTVDTLQRCLICGSPVIDIHTESDSVGQAAQRTAASPMETKKPQPGTKSAVQGCRSCLLVVSILLLVVAVPFLLFPDLVAKIPPPGFLLTPTTAAENQEAISTEIAGFEMETRPTERPRPTPTKTVNLPKLAQDTACFSNYSSGITCLDDTGWVPVKHDDLPAAEGVKDMAVCPDGRILWLTNRDVFAFDGKQWADLRDGTASYASKVACGPENTIWTVGMGSADYFDGTAWTSQSFEEVYDGAQSATIQGAAVDSGGVLWIAAHDAVLRYDPSGWTVFQTDNGFQKDYLIRGVALDSQGLPWVVHVYGLVHYDGSAWKEYPAPTAYELDAVMIDSSDRVWVGTNRSVSVFEKDHWAAHHEIGDQAGGVQSLAMDGQGRIWAGTKWGVAVLTEKQWSSYQMHNSDMVANDLAAIIVLKDGPALPERQEKAAGGLEGNLLLDGKPLANARVEICVEMMGIIFRGATPCTGQPYVAGTKTNAEGHFTFTDLPTGFYSVTIQMPDGKWKVRSQALRVGSVQVLVYPGETQQLEDLDLGK